MAYLNKILLVYLLVILFRLLGVSSHLLSFTAFDSHSDSLYRQTIYPGCKSHGNSSYVSQHVWSSPCNDGVFQSVITNTIDLRKCFQSSEKQMKYPDVVEGYVTFDLANPSDLPSLDCNGNCFCHVILHGPPGTHFQFKTVRKGSFDPFRLTLEMKSQLNIVSKRHGASGSSSNNNLDLYIYIKETEIKNTTSTLTFQAVFDCQQYLQVNCSSAGGYIQTPGWDKGKDYVNDMYSCVTLHVPEGHLIMISIVSVDLEHKEHPSSCFDALKIHKGDNCVGNDEIEICELHDLLPTVLNETQAVSFSFTSDMANNRTGFRLLYSFHSSSEVPFKLSDGKWDCSVSYYESFKQHFVCLSEAFCSDTRDQIGCPTDDLCGSSLVNFGESCYRFFEPSHKTTWNYASHVCNHYDGYLAILNTASEWENAMEFIKSRNTDDPVFLGLRMTSSTKLPEIYHDTWLWSDGTLAVYFDISFVFVDPPLCTVVTGTNQTVTMTTCNEKKRAAFLCGTNFVTSEQAQRVSKVSLATPSSWNLENMATCLHKHHTHTFLACDASANCSSMEEKATLPCSGKFFPPVPFFTCQNQMEHIPYTLVCDFRPDCCDASDEDFCEFPACEGRKYHKCTASKQCILRKQMCDKRSDCVDKSDESKCHQRLIPSELRPQTVQPPALVDFTGDGNFMVTPLLSFTCPESHFLCPDKGYCLPVYVRCNDVYDCPGREDETDCDRYTCPGFYRCRKSKICLHKDHLCDGVFQCPQRDDELMCNFTCPENCHCYGYAFICSANFRAEKYTELRYLEARDTGMKPEYLLNNNKLIHLSLRNCEITVLGEMDFPNLQSLDLSFNKLQEMKSSHLSKLRNIKSLSLAYNLFMKLNSLTDTEFGFPKIIKVNLSGIMIQEISDSFLDTFPNVKYLNLSGSRLKKLPRTGFQSLNKVHMLDLRGCPMDIFYHGVFQGLNHLDTVYSDNYKLCCPTILPEGMNSENCHAPTDEVSSCDALLRTDMFRLFLALYALLALIGNLGSFVYRVFIEGGANKMGHEIFVTHLSAADFLMGVYLAIIGIADRIYYGDYRWNDAAWKQSVACKVAGFLSLVSSEVSAYFICLITLERVLVIGFPHKNLRFSQWSAHGACVVVWLIGLTLALIPLLPITSHWQFYSQSGICIPLPITRKQFDGSDYAFAVMIVINFVLFVFIAVGQLLIYWSIRVNTVRPKNCKRKSKDMAIAGRLLAVVMTDFMCWFPIGLLGLMARSGVPISGDVNVIMAILVLPFNSALNPFLYTLSVVMERRRNEQARKSCEDSREPSSSNLTTRMSKTATEKKKENSYCKEEAFKLFNKFLEEGLLTPGQVRRQVWNIYEG